MLQDEREVSLPLLQQKRFDIRGNVQVVEAKFSNVSLKSRRAPSVYVNIDRTGSSSVISYG